MRVYTIKATVLVPDELTEKAAKLSAIATAKSALEAVGAELVFKEGAAKRGPLKLTMEQRQRRVEVARMMRERRAAIRAARMA